MQFLLTLSPQSLNHQLSHSEITFNLYHHCQLTIMQLCPKVHFELYVAVTGRKRTLFHLGQKWLNSANQVLRASPASCTSTSAIRCLYEQLCPWKSLDLGVLHRLRTQYSRHTVKLGKIQRLVSPVLQQLRTHVIHQQWEGSLVYICSNSEAK